MYYNIWEEDKEARPSTFDELTLVDLGEHTHIWRSLQVSFEAMGGKLEDYRESNHSRESGGSDADVQVGADTENAELHPRHDQYPHSPTGLAFVSCNGDRGYYRTKTAAR